jgi:hypothetical protein
MEVRLSVVMAQAWEVEVEGEMAEAGEVQAVEMEVQVEEVTVVVLVKQCIMQICNAREFLKIRIASHATNDRTANAATCVIYILCIQNLYSCAVRRIVCELAAPCTVCGSILNRKPVLPTIFQGTC